MECPEKFKLGRLAANSGSRFQCWTRGMQYMCSMLEERKPVSQIREQVFSWFQEQYRTEWFLLPWQRKVTASEDASSLLQYLDTFSYAQVKEIKSNQLMRIEVGREFEGVKVENILLRINLLLTYETGELEAVILEKRFLRQYSCHARLEAHQPYASPELAGMLYVLREHPNLQVTLVQAGRRRMDEQNGLKKISLAAREVQWSAWEAYEKMLAGIQMAPKCDCSNCHYGSICKMTQKISCEQIPSEQEKAEYSDEQKEIMRQIDGNMCVSAGPGSGKTAVIAGRVREMIRAGIPAREILVLTHTKEAARELARRIPETQQVIICTIHALAYRILLDYPEVVGEKRLAGMLDEKILLLRILKHAPQIWGMSYEQLGTQYGLLEMLLKYFAYIEQNGLAKFRETYPEKDTEGILWVKELFDSVFRKGGFITYDEQISEAVSLMAGYPGILEEIQRKHRYILVDEAQDLDGMQADFIRLLSGNRKNLTLVGDDDQAVFGFRGGSNAFMLHFTKIYPDAKGFILNVNYRSSAEIVKASEALISANQNRIPKMAVPAAGACGLPVIHIEKFADDSLPGLLLDVKKKLGCRWGDIAVISKNNRDLYRLCGILREYNRNPREVCEIPYLEPKYYLMNDPVFCGLLDLLILYLDGMHQDLPLYRLLKNLGIKAIKGVRTQSLYQGLLAKGQIFSMEEQDLNYYRVSVSDSEILQVFAKISRALAMLYLPDLCRAVRMAAQILFGDQMLALDEVVSEIEELIQVRRINSINELRSLMEMYQLLGDNTRIRYSTETDRIRFLTAHDAKGQQFQAVFVYGIDLFESGYEEEDRRLLYVAMTRAEKCLITSELLKGKSNFLRDFIDYVKVWR